jgi:PKD repeat protein
MNKNYLVRALRALTVVAAVLLVYGGWRILSVSVTAQTPPFNFSVRAVDATTAATKTSFFVGETASIVFTLTNQSGTAQTITNLEHEEIPVSLSIMSSESNTPEVRKGTRGGTGRTVQDPLGNTIWTSVPKQSVVLSSGQSVTVRINNVSAFFARKLDPGTYTLAATYGTIQAQTTFTVAIVEAQSVPVLQQMAAGSNETDKQWANAYLDVIAKPSISGTITNAVGGAPVANVTLELTGSLSNNATSRADGKYGFNSLTSGGEYTVTPSLEGYTFEPVRRTFSNVTTKQINANFTATRVASGVNVTGNATVTASSILNGDYSLESVIDGSTSGVGWGMGGGGWNDGTPNVFPDWVEINFGATKAIDWINVYTLQDNYANPIEPTLTQTFTLYGIKDFDVQYWNGAWANVPGGVVNGNTNVWRRFTFPTINTTKIRVNIRGAADGHSRITEIQAFHANVPPTVSITGTYSGAPGATFQFTNNATDSDGTISTYHWDFGDGSTATGATPSHTFAAARTYTVTLLVTDDGGETAQATKTVTITAPNQAPVASAGGPYSGGPGTNIFFEGRASFDPDGTISTYQWSFGDSTTGTGSSVEHAYASPGTYTATLTVTDNNGLTNSQTATVAINSPPTVSLTGPTNDQTFTAPASISLSANATDTGGSILKVEFFQGTTLLATDSATPFTGNWTNVPAGSYTLTAVATDNLGAVTVSAPVSINVTTNSAPTVSITLPANNAHFNAPANISVNATAADSDGSINKVEFFQGTTLIGTDTASPYTVSWTNVAAGSYSVTAKATDNLGAFATSAPINVHVDANSVPTVAITNPANNTIFVAPASATLSAAAADTDGTITKVEFFQGTTLIGTDTTSPYTLSWTNVPAGSYSLTAKATDNLGAIQTSSAVNVLVNTAPSVSLTSPTNGQVVQAPATVTLAANASDSDGTISKVDFYQGTTLIGTDTAPPFTFNWTNVPFGSYSITAKATDNTGTEANSAAVNLIVNSAPIVSITSPVNRAMLRPWADMVINVNASDPDGTISQVEFYQGTTLIGTDNTAPYSVTLNNVSSGSYVFTAKATDNRGAVMTSAATAVTTPVFFDDFNDNSLSTTNWSISALGSPVVVSEQGQQLQITLPPGTASYNGIISNDSYDMRGATVQVDAFQPVSQSGWVENALKIEKDAGNYLLINVGAGSILFRQSIHFANDQLVIPYAYPAHRYWRIRHDVVSNAVSFETSADAVTWNTWKTVVAGFSLTSTKFHLTAGAWGTGNSAPGAAIYNDFQYISDVTTILVDDFNDNSIDTAKWTANELFSGFTDTSLPVTETAQRFEIGPLLQNTGGSHYRGLRSITNHDFTGGAAYVELVQAASLSTNGDAMFTIGPNVDNYYRIYVSGGDLIGLKKVGGAKTTLFSISYDSVNHRYLRIRHDASSGLIMETAASSGSGPGTWVQRYTEAWNSAVTLTSLLFEVKGGTSQAEANAPGKVIFDNFTFKRNGQAPVQPPTLSSVSPVSGPSTGGTVLTLTGTQFVSGATVSVGGTAATNVTVISGTSITATAPAQAAGVVSITVINPDGGSATLNNAYTYTAQPPTLTSVSPTSGSTTGGTVLTLTGTQFVSGATVSVGGTAATNVTVTSATSITATAPGHAAGVVSITVTNPGGASATLNNSYTYTSPATVLLEDDFNDNSINTSKWTTTELFSGFTDTSLGVNETSQRFEIGPLLLNTGGSHYRGVRSLSTYDFTGGAAYVELVQPASSSTDGDAMFTIGPNVDNYYRIYVSGGQLIGQRKIGGTKTTLFSISYDAVNHRFLRIRHTVSGNMIMETAPGTGSGPGTWVQQYNQLWSSSVTVTSLYFEVKGGTWQSEANAAGTIIFDNFSATK